MFGSVVFSLAFAASALANVFITNPVGSSSFAAGQAANVSWIDDGNSPSLAQFGLANFGLYVGNALQQTLLQTIATEVNVSTTSAVPFTPQASVGASSDEYFIRVTSLSFTNSGSPEEAFSAKFTLTGMTGSFNSSVQAEINGQSTAPIGGPTSASSAGMPTASASASGSSSASASASSAKPSSNGAGKPVITTGLVGLVAALVGASLL